MIGYRLFTKRKDGSLGSLFINRREKLKPQVLYEAADHKTKGFKHRPGWHLCSIPHAPHLTKKGRVWCRVWFHDYEIIERPASQGEFWYLARWMEIIEVVK